MVKLYNYLRMYYLRTLSKAKGNISMYGASDVFALSMLFIISLHHYIINSHPAYYNEKTSVIILIN